MARLTFSYDPQKGSVSSEFAGSVALQCIFSGTGKHVIFVESRIGDEMPWAVLRTVVVKARDVFSIPEASKGQVYRIFTDSEPESVETSPISGGGGGSSYDIPDEENNDGEVNTMQEILKAFKNFPEGTTIQEALQEIEGGALQEEDIEDVFFPKEVSDIVAGEHDNSVILMLTGNNIDDEDEITWLLTMDGSEQELTGEGRSLVLPEEAANAYKAASSVTAKVSVASYTSSEYVLKSPNEGD